MKHQSRRSLAAIRVLLVVSLLWINVRAGCTEANFATPNNFLTGTQPLSVGVGDFNGDGKNDLAVANFSSNNLSILRGNGTGGFGPAATIIAGTNPSALVVADFNGDAKFDLAVTNAGSDNVSIILGDGNGAFGLANNFIVGANPSAIAAGDFNSDGKTDLAVANADTNDISVLLGNGAGAFGSATNFRVGYTPIALVIGDFNGDGFRDIAVANFFYDDNGDNISVLLGNGGGAFNRAAELYAGSSPIAIVTADLNNDGKHDLAVVNADSWDVSIFMGLGTGGFMTQTVFDVEVSPTSIVTGDFNSDSRIDLAVANGDSNNISVLLGNGGGGFGTARNFVTGTSPSALSTGDFNADGSTDLAVANADSNNLSILLNGCAASSTAPVLLTDATTGRAAVLESVNKVRDPFPVFTTLNFSSDQRTRIMLFAVNIPPGETSSVVTAQAQDSQNRIYSMPVEFVGTVPNYDWLSQIVVKMPDALTNLVSVQVTISVRGQVSNKALVQLKP